MSGSEGQIEFAALPLNPHRQFETAAGIGYHAFAEQIDGSDGA
jgi:hypothetical protein